MRKTANKYIERFGAATTLVFQLFDETSAEDIWQMKYVNGLMLAKKGVNTLQEVYVERGLLDDVFLKIVLAGNQSEQENNIYRNIMMGLTLFGIDHTYMGMVVNVS
tara:strand:+ start:892 stop:1209 length:318 start_codon:yes stop_codon:yes gene_type:complete